MTKGGRVPGQRVDHAAGHGVDAGAVVGGALSGHERPGPVALLDGVGGVEVALGGHAAHVVHGGGDRSPDARICGRGGQGHAAPAADADAPGVDVVAHGQEVDGGLEVLDIDVRGVHVAGLAAGLAGEAGVEGDGEVAALRHRLRVQAAALLLDGAEGAGHGQGGQLALRPLGPVQVGDQGDAEAGAEGDLLAVYGVGPREDLVPLGGRFGSLMSHVSCLLVVRPGAVHRGETSRPADVTRSVVEPASGASPGRASGPTSSWAR